jgi:hypothetical protein
VRGGERPHSRTGRRAGSGHKVELRGARGPAGGRTPRASGAAGAALNPVEPISAAAAVLVWCCRVQSVANTTIRDRVDL